jgi:hypothetical protein
MPVPAPDAGSSSLLLAKCGSTLFCIGRIVVLWAVVLAVLLFGALRNRLSALSARCVTPEGDKKKKKS